MSWIDHHPCAMLSVYQTIGGSFHWQAHIRWHRGSRLTAVMRSEKAFRTRVGARDAGVRDCKRMHIHFLNKYNGWRYVVIEEDKGKKGPGE